MAIPLDYIPAAPISRAYRLVARLTRERNVTDIVVGLPRHLDGSEGASAQWARQFAHRLATMLPDTRVCLVDERRSTIAARAMLHGRGIAEKDQRQIIDSTAAQVILEQALETQRLSGMPPGEVVSHRDSDVERPRKDVNE